MADEYNVAEASSKSNAAVGLEALDFDPEAESLKREQMYASKKQAFDTLIYPQGFQFFYPTSSNPGLKLFHRHIEPCASCGANSPPMRHVLDWPYYCVTCCKAMGLGGPSDEVFFPEEIIMQIMCYLPTFHDMANCAMVSHRWLSAFNYSEVDESDIRRVKAYLIGREFYYMSKRPDYKDRAQVKEYQLMLAPLLGEWLDPATTDDRKLALSRMIALSPFYAEPLGIASRGFSENEAKIEKDPKSQLRFLTCNGLTVHPPQLSDEKGLYSVRCFRKKQLANPSTTSGSSRGVADKNLPIITVYIDPETGHVDHVSEEKKRKWCCLM